MDEQASGNAVYDSIGYTYEVKGFALPFQHYDWSEESIARADEMFAQGKKAEEIAASTSVTIRTVKRHLFMLKILRDGSPGRVVSSSKSASKKKEAAGGADSNNKDTKKVYKFLIQQMTCCSPKALKSIMKAMPSSIGVRVSEATVCREIQALEWSRSNPRVQEMLANRNTASEISKRYVYASSIVDQPDSNILFLTKAVFHFHTLPPTHFWTGPGLPVINPKDPAWSQGHTYVMVALSVTGTLELELKERAFEAQEVQDFLVKTVLPKVKPGQIVVFDESKFHCSDIVQAAFGAQNTKLVSLPSWSPFLSPAEEVVASAKTTQLDLSATNLKSRDQLTQFVNDFFPQGLRVDLQPYFTKVRKHLPAAIAMQPIEI